MISIDLAKMKVARRLNGTIINGYGGYYGKTRCDEGDFFIIVIPHDPASVTDLIREIENKE